MQRTSIIIFLVVSVIFFSACISPVLCQSTNQCAACHSSISQYLDIVESDSSTSIPVSLEVGETVTVKVTIKNTCSTSRYSTLSDVSVTLSSQSGHFSVASATYTISSLKIGSTTISWSITGISAGTDMLIISAQATNSHNKVSFTDSYSSALSVVDESSVELSTSQLAFESGTAKTLTFNLTAKTQIQNITISKSSSLTNLITLNYTDSLNLVEAGESLTISVFFYGNQSITNTGQISISWYNSTGAIGFATVNVYISEESTQTTTESQLNLIGRITGLLSLGLLFSSLALGLIHKGKAKLRRHLHCSISWLLVGLSIFHGIILVLGPYYDFLLDEYVILGYAATLMMGVSSASGLLEKKITAVTNHRTWLWTHRILLVLAVILAVIHAIMMGTDFDVIRNLGA